MIVALLCLTLLVDSANACWWLRHHRSRGQVCQPVACRPATPASCTIVSDEAVVFETFVVNEQPDCVCAAGPAEHATVDHAAVEQVIDHHAGETKVLEHGVVEHAGRAADSVVVHGPTIVTAPAAEQPDSAAAQPMPLATAGAAVPQTPAPAQEPIPDLKPANPVESAVAPVSNEQPMPAQAASGEPTEADQAVEPSRPMPAPVEDLAGEPEMKLPKPAAKEPNLFDLYDDEADDEASPSQEPAADSRPEMADDDAGEPAEDSPAEPAPAEPAPADEAEMTEDEATEAAATEAEAADGDSEMAEEAAPSEESSTEEADAAPEAAAEQPEQPEQPEQTGADAADAAVTVPNEPMRRWTDETGTHHTRGWLVEVRGDRVRILKVNGRHTTVRTESLSAADRDYVSAVGARLAREGQGTSPAPTATAGM
jgi:hypothetical protein